MLYDIFGPEIGLVGQSMGLIMPRLQVLFF